RARAVEILEDAGARALLQSLSEARADGRVAEMLAVGGEPDEQALVARLAAAGLVRREVQVSCRKSGRSLFRLPSPDALAIVTASNAVCSECGAAVADERAEELVTPTQLASTMLKDGAWLLSSLRSMLGALGIPERETASRPANEEGEAQAHASRLVVVATGKIQDEARARLREHARRRSRAGSETEVVFIEGLDSASTELRRAVERVSQEALARELYELDSSAGFNVGYALAARFRLAQRKGALRDLRSEEHTSELQSPYDLVCRLLLEKKKNNKSEPLMFHAAANLLPHAFVCVIVRCLEFSPPADLTVLARLSVPVAAFEINS